jgi:hypothetical protein
MDTREFSARGILAGQAPADEPVTVKGWVRTRRDSKAGISFVHLTDGSSFHPVQVVAPSALPNYTNEILKLTTGCAIEATGTIVPSPARGQPFDKRVQRELLRAASSETPRGAAGIIAIGDATLDEPSARKLIEAFAPDFPCRTLIKRTDTPLAQNLSFTFCKQFVETSQHFVEAIGTACPTID